MYDGPIVLFNDPAMVEYFLKTKFSVYDKGPVFRERAQDTLGHGIFNIDGARWKSQRKLAANIFNVKNFKDFVNETFAAEMQVFGEVLAGHAAAGREFDLQELFFRFTFDSFTKVAFGIDMHSMTAKEKVPFMDSFDNAQRVVVNRILTPLWQIVDYLTGTAKTQAKDVATIREFGLKVIKEKRELLKVETSDGNDLLSLLMRVTDEDGNPPSDEMLVDYVLNFLIAGRDTTAQALSWTFYMLHKNPKALAALHEEIERVLGGVAPTYEQIKNEMPYANAVFHEALRLYPSVPLEMKQANADDTLPDGTFIPKGCLVSWSPYAMGRTEAIWGPDAREFKPERWIQMTKQPSPFDYPVFNAGPRVCLGKNMAELEGCFVLVQLVRQFNVKVVNEQDVTYSFSLTLPMDKGLKVKVSERS
ncbi:cytochrome P450 [Chytriomyces sp. MP71]|nr:cytochrome P450 [Chytriomyces sp. MP71]